MMELADVKPRISVVVPCFNLGRYLNEALDSVFSQSFQDFEVMIVDDGSTDETTRRLLNNLSRKRTRILRHEENLGLPAARNTGVRESRGELICALDADDLLEPTYFEKAIRVLDEDPSVTFVSHWLQTFDRENWRWTPERCDLQALLDMNTVNGAALVRRQALLDVGLWDESLRDGCEDWELWIRFVERGYRGVILPEVLFHYRRRSDSMSWKMKTVEVHLGLLAQLVKRHEDAYREALPNLLQRREAVSVDLSRKILNLEAEFEDRLLPDLQRRREELVYLRKRLERIENEEKLIAEKARLEGEVSSLEEAARAAERQLRGLKDRLHAREQAFESLQALLETSEQECRARETLIQEQKEALRAYSREVHMLEKEISDLRQSISWRITAFPRWLMKRPLQFLRGAGKR